jgi:hypothetical protein
MIGSIKYEIPAGNYSERVLEIVDGGLFGWFFHQTSERLYFARPNSLRLSGRTGVLSSFALLPLTYRAKRLVRQQFSKHELESACLFISDENTEFSGLGEIPRQPLFKCVRAVLPKPEGYFSLPVLRRRGAIDEQDFTGHHSL